MGWVVSVGLVVFALALVGLFNTILNDKWYR